MSFVLAGGGPAPFIDDSGRVLFRPERLDGERFGVEILVVSRRASGSLVAVGDRRRCPLTRSPNRCCASPVGGCAPVCHPLLEASGEARAVNVGRCAVGDARVGGTPAVASVGSESDVRKACIGLSTIALPTSSRSPTSDRVAAGV